MYGMYASLGTLCLCVCLLTALVVTHTRTHTRAHTQTPNINEHEYKIILVLMSQQKIEETITVSEQESKHMNNTTGNHVVHVEPATKMINKTSEYFMFTF